jgi:hypothetical protein
MHVTKVLRDDGTFKSDGARTDIFVFGLDLVSATSGKRRIVRLTLLATHNSVITSTKAVFPKSARSLRTPKTDCKAELVYANGRMH